MFLPSHRLLAFLQHFNGLFFYDLLSADIFLSHHELNILLFLRVLDSFLFFLEITLCFRQSLSWGINLILKFLSAPLFLGSFFNSLFVEVLDDPIPELPFSVVITSLLKPHMGKIYSFKLVLIKNERYRFLQKLYPFEEISYLKQFIDWFVYFALPFRYFPISHFATNKLKEFIEICFDIVGKAMLFCFLAFEMAICKGHFKEVDSEKLQEKEQPKKWREDPPDVGKNVNKLQVFSTNPPGDWWSFQPDINICWSIIEDRSSLFDRLTLQTGCLIYLGEEGNMGIICFKNILIKMNRIIFESVLNYLHVASVQVIFKRWLDVWGVYRRRKLKYCYAPTAIDIAWFFTSKFYIYGLLDVTDVIMTSYFKRLIERKAPPASNPRRWELFSDRWNHREMLSRALLEFYLSALECSIWSPQIWVGEVPRLWSLYFEAALGMSKGEHVRIVVGWVLVGAQGGHLWLYVVFLFGGDKDGLMIDDVQ